MLTASSIPYQDILDPVAGYWPALKRLTARELDATLSSIECAGVLSSPVHP
jgi:hypothetical protein